MLVLFLLVYLFIKYFIYLKSFLKKCNECRQKSLRYQLAMLIEISDLNRSKSLITVLGLEKFIN